ncbi:hypothetical protein FS749_011478 [Ceratobasidium sp. UAMH 11750]|nr:hypothetical protein FS749_011478 [Ceratobasidium sp. UAMH 11750]
MRWLLSSLLLGSLHLASATLQIVPGATWISSGNNKTIQAHGGGIIKVQDTYYWVGEDKTGGWPFYAINCYSSKNLVEWTFVNTIFSRQSEGDFGPNRIVERPKILRNGRLQKYVMWMHIDDYPEYSEAKVGVATSYSVCGNYTYQGSFRPGGLESRDMTVFRDTDGQAYLITEQREAGTAIYQLSPDYDSVDRLVYRWPEKYESPAMIKSRGVYFLFSSGRTYWRPNDNYYSTSTSLAGPWSPWEKFAPEGSLTFRSQTTAVLPFGINEFMFMGDRWDGRDNWWEPQYLMRSTYVWLPLEIDGTTARMPNGYTSWVPYVQYGAWTRVRNETWYEAESASMSGAAVIVPCSGCSGRQAVGWIGGSGNGTLTFNNITSASNVRTTLRIQTTNGDRELRDTTVTTGNLTYVIPVLQVRNMVVTINGISQVIPVLPSENGEQPQPVALHTDLRSGSNTITISGLNGEYAPNIDAIVVDV